MLLILGAVRGLGNECQRRKKEKRRGRLTTKEEDDFYGLARATLDGRLERRAGRCNR